MWPDDRELPLEVGAAFGANLLADPSTWSWTDLSSRLTAEPIRSRAGRSSGAGQVSPGTCTLSLVNDDGALTPRNPASVYWPNVALGAPLRVSIRRVEDTFGRTLTSGWGTAASGQVWSTYGVGGTIAATDSSMGGGTARQSVPIAGAFRTSWLPGLSLRDCRVRLSGVSLPFSDVTGASVEPGNILLRAQNINSYYLARVEITTAEQVLCQLYNPAGTQLANVTVAGLTHSAAQTLEVVAEIVGSRLRMKVWATGAAEPAGWAVTAADTSLTLPGGVGVRTGVAGGNTNTKPIVASYDSITVYVDRFTGYADQWEPTLTPIRQGESASTVRVTASGPLRRLDQGIKPARSSPARYIPTTNPVAYWPLEDGQLVSEGAALVGSEPLRPFVGTHPSGAVATFVQWGRGDLAPWLPDAVSRAGNHGLAIIWAPVRMSATSQWCVDFIYRSGTDASNSTVDINPSYLPGGALGWPQLTLLPDVQGIDVSMNGEPETTSTAPTLFDGKPHHVRWLVWQNGAQVSWGAYVDGVNVNGGTTVGNFTLPAVSSIALTAAAQAGADIAQGHLAVWASNPNHVDAVAAAFGHPGELAADRVARLCAEEGIPVSVLPGDSEPLGPQPTAGVMDLLRDAETADLGVLYELGFGLGYRPRGGRYNTAPTMSVDLATYAVSARGGGDVLSPTYDDQDLRNEWTVSRTGGRRSEPARDVAHQQRSGVYSDSDELNVATDAVLQDHAAWRVRLGTFDGLRESTFPLDLAANPALVDGWLSCGVGSRILRTNPPSQYGPDPLDRLVEGWQETIGPRSWLVQVTPSPASPWQVAEADGEQRAPADGSTLGGALALGGMSFQLTSTTENGPWRTTAGDATVFPLDTRVGGEKTTASAIGSSVIDTFSRTTANGWGTADTGQSWTVAGGSTSDFTTASPPTVARHSHGTVNVSRRSVVGISALDVDVVCTTAVTVLATGSSIQVGLMGRYLDGNNYYFAELLFETNQVINLRIEKNVGGTFTNLTGDVATGLTHTTGGAYRLRMQISGSTIRAKAWSTDGTEPVAWTKEQVDPGASLDLPGAAGCRSVLSGTNTLPVVIAYANFEVLNPQTVTLSARGVNGVTRAWPAGTEVDVWSPAIAPL